VALATIISNSKIITIWALPILLRRQLNGEDTANFDIVSVGRDDHNAQARIVATYPSGRMAFVHQVAVEPDGTFALDRDTLVPLHRVGQFQTFQILRLQDAIFSCNLKSQMLVKKSVLGGVRN
jgi:hypothetical protein